jgi:hypothetical protein
MYHFKWRDKVSLDTVSEITKGQDEMRRYRRADSDGKAAYIAQYTSEDEDIELVQHEDETAFQALIAKVKAGTASDAEAQEVMTECLEL